MVSPPPQVSVLLPLFNAARYLPEALDSLSRQTFEDFEIIAVDNGSTDATRDIVAAHARSDARVRMAFCAERGVVMALNHALALARAPLVARMDGDDIAWPDRLAAQVHAMAQSPDLSLLGSWTVSIDGAGTEIKTRRKVTAHAEIVAQLAAGQNPIVHPTAMMPRAAVMAVGGYRRAFRTSEDYDLWLRLAEVGRVANLPQVLLSYRIHPDSVSQQQTFEAFDMRMVARLCAVARRSGLSEPLAADRIDLAAALALDQTTLSRHRARHVDAQLRRYVRAESALIAGRRLLVATRAAAEIPDWAPRIGAQARIAVARIRRRRRRWRS